MRTAELIKEIKRLPIQKKIYIIEKTIHSIRKQQDDDQLSRAAKALLVDYSTDKELTAFTNIDYVNFYEAR